MPRNGPLRLTLVATIATISGCTSSGSATTTRTRSTSMATQASPSNEEIVRSVYEVSLNTGDMGLLDRVVAPDFVGPRGGRGPSAFARTLLELRAAFPDIHYTVEDVVEEGDRVAIRWTWTGTHTGQFRDFAPSERRVSSSGVAIFQLRDGKIVQGWLETDRLGFLQQIGALPPELSARLQPAGSR